MLPTIYAIFAKNKSHGSTLSIFAINLLFGWTLIGWVISIVLAFRDDTAYEGQKKIPHYRRKPPVQIGLGGGLVVLFIFILIVFNMIVGTNTSKKLSEQIVENDYSQIPERSVNSYELMSAYQNNEISADNNFKGKIVKVDGVIEDIGRDLLGTPYVSLQTDSPIYSIQCMFDKSFENKLSHLTKGQEVYLEGRVSGKFGNVILHHCSL